MGAPGFTSLPPLSDVYAANFLKYLQSVTPQNSTQTLGSQASGASTLTGVKNSELESQLFGKAEPLFVGGKALIGGRIIEGPFLHSISGVDVFDVIVDIATPVDVTSSRSVDYINLNGTTSWTQADGGLGPFSVITVNIKTGSETQTPFASSVSRYGDRAVAYRPHILVEILNCPLAPFNNVLPFISAFVNQEDSIARADALARLARYSRYDDSEFDISVSGADDAWIVDQQYEFIQYVQQFRSIFRTWNIVCSDKLRIFESDLATVTAPMLRKQLALDSLKLMHKDADSTPRQRSLQIVDRDRDNDFNTVQGRLEQFPEPSTASQSVETITLPIVTTMDAAQEAVEASLRFDDLARRSISATALAESALIGVEAGDIASFADDPSLSFRGIVTQVARNHDFSTDFKAERAI